MPDRANSMEATLDSYIDALLAGADWRDAAPPIDPDNRDLRGLVAIAQGLVELGRRTPGGGSAEREGAWTRIWRFIHHGRPGTAGAHACVAVPAFA